MAFGDEVAKLRDQEGLTQDELAVLCGVSRATIQNLEKGKPSSTATLEKIAEALEVPVGVFFA